MEDVTFWIRSVMCRRPVVPIANYSDHTGVENIGAFHTLIRPWSRFARPKLRYNLIRAVILIV